MLAWTKLNKLSLPSAFCICSLTPTSCRNCGVGAQFLFLPSLSPLASSTVPPLSHKNFEDLLVISDKKHLLSILLYILQLSFKSQLLLIRNFCNSARLFATARGVLVKSFHIRSQHEDSPFFASSLTLLEKKIVNKDEHTSKFLLVTN
jgi:hypothetical protein